MNSASKSSQQLYFVSAWVDGLFIGFLSLGLFVYFRYVSPQALITPAQWNLAQAMIWAINWPHVFASSCRLYQSETARQQYPLTAYWVPVFLLLLSTLAFLFPAGFAPYVIKVLILWAPYHYSGQTIGLTLLYGRRAGIPVRNWMRICVFGFAYCSFLTQTSQLEAFSMSVPYPAIPFPLLGIPPWTANVFRFLTYGFAAALAWAVISLRRRDKITVPWIVGLPLLVQYLWFIHGADLNAFQLFVSAFHGLQYLLIAWSMQLALNAPWKTAKPLTFLARKTLLWAALTFLGGMALFYLIPSALARMGSTFAFASAVMYATFQFHHYFVDGVIWKLRDEGVSRYLTGNVLQLASAPAVHGEVP